MDAVKVGGGSLVSYAFKLCVREPEAPCKELRVWVSAGKGPVSAKTTVDWEEHHASTVKARSSHIFRWFHVF